MGINDKGFSNNKQANTHKKVGSQGASGAALGGTPVYGASQPVSGGKVPHKMGTVSSDALLQPQNGVMPQVGK